MPEVFLIAENGDKLGKTPTRQALEQADLAGLDLVEIAPNANPPVCRIMDYDKYRFEQKKKLSQQKKNTKQVQTKEIKLRPTTDIGDYNVKLKNIIRFLEDKDKVKVTVRFRGREVTHHELAFKLLNRLIQDVQEYGIIEFEPKFEGRQVVMVIGPKNK